MVEETVVTKVEESSVGEMVKGTPVQETPSKEKTKTEAFKTHLQIMIKDVLGPKIKGRISQKEAWDLFKEIMNGTIEYVYNDKANSLSLAGIGKFAILKSDPRGLKAGLDKDGNKIEGAKVWEFVPRFRFYASSKVDDDLAKRYGLIEDEGNKVKQTHYGVFKTREEEKK